MKKKLIAIIILTIMIFPVFFDFYKVGAFTGEVDPEGYINMPLTILIKDGVGKGTISLSSSASGYNISYQKVDLTAEQFNAIQNKNKELKDYIKESNITLKEKSANVKTLQTEMDNLKNSETATSEQITEAENKYKEAIEEYQDFYDTVETNSEKLKSEYYALIPDYTDSWIATTNTSDNVQLDLKAYTGTIHFALWGKITNGTNTYYDMNIYTSEIKENEVSTGDKNSQWTDFSEAKFELKKTSMSGATLEIFNVTPKEESSYYMVITADGKEPEEFKDGSYLYYDEESECLRGYKIEKYAELNQDLYVSILEKQNDAEKVAVVGKKLERFVDPQYNDAFYATFMSYEATQIITRFTHYDENDRNIRIKVGKITDLSILKKIKNQDSSGFSDLLSFAKLNDGIYDKVLTSDKDNYAIGYKTTIEEGNDNEVINLDDLEDEKYYFLYIEALDENGKYIHEEAVTLAQADVIKDNEWYLFFYGNDDFKWIDLENDETTAPETIPNTGIRKYAIIISALAVIISASYIQVKKMKEIK